MEINFQSPATNGGAAALKGKLNKFKGKNRGKNSNKLVGIRQRPSGRWVAEIKDTTKKIRMWLGTFETAEEAARAYDEAACLLRGSNTRTNFIPQFSTNSPIASRIQSLLKKKTPVPKPIVGAVDSTIEDDGRLFDGAYKPDMSNCLGETEVGVWDWGNGVSILEDFERMKVERQISASLYAINGVREYMEAVHEQASESIWDLAPICSLFS